MRKTLTYFFIALFFSGFSVVAATTASVEKEAQKLPLGADFSFINTVGAGSAFEAYKQDPNVYSTLYAFPHYKSDPFWGKRELKIYGELQGQFEWIGKDNPFPGQFGKKFDYGDIKIRAQLLNAIEVPEIGFSFTPLFKIEAPISKGSRVANRVVGLGGNFAAKFKKAGWSFTYKPSTVAYIHSASYKSDRCNDDADPADRLTGNMCKVSGRQTLAQLKNSIYLGYSQGNHGVTLMLRTYHNFLREKGNEKPAENPGSDIQEQTLGVLEYSYKIPVDFEMSLLVGVSGLQAAYDITEDFRVPFFSFADPSKNVTELYVSLDMSI